MPQSEPSSSRGLIVHRGHTSAVCSVAFSPDGKSVASGSEDKSIRIWDAYRPVPIGNPFNGHTGWVWSTCYSPLGNMIVSGGEDRAVRLWNTETGRQVGEALWGHRDDVSSVAFSPSGNFIASGSDDTTVSTRVVSSSGDHTIRVWDIERRVTVGKALQEHENAVRSVSFSPDGSQLVSGSFDNTLRLWDIRTGNAIGTPFKGHTDIIFSVAFSPSGTYVASASEDETVRIWDIRTHRQAEEPFEQHTGIVYSVAYSPCGRRVTSASEDKTIMIWNTSGSDSAAGHDSCSLAEEKNENNEGSKPGDSTTLADQLVSTRDMFERLLRDGCDDLPSQIDPELDTAILRFGSGFGDICKGELRNGTGVQVRTWRASLIEQCSKETLEFAINDIQTWSKMKHKNVQQLMGIAIPNGHYLGLITERMEYGSLHEYMRSNPSINRHQMCTQIASGLVYMHQLDVVHGDLKALNVLVSSDGVAKLGNFGLSALSVAYIPFSETNNSLAGVARWAAPELLSVGAAKTKESDIYALGMTMLEIITGDVPYPQCKWEIQVLNQVIQGELPSRPVDLKDDESGNKMWGLLMSCWNTNPKLRPSAKEVVISLIVADTV